MKQFLNLEKIVNNIHEQFEENCEQSNCRDIPEFCSSEIINLVEDQSPDPDINSILAIRLLKKVRPLPQGSIRQIKNYFNLNY